MHDPVQAPPRPNSSQDQAAIAPAIQRSRPGTHRRPAAMFRPRAPGVGLARLLAAVSATASAAVLTACGGGGGTTPPDVPTASATLVRAQSGDLRAFLVARVRERAGLGSPVPISEGGATGGAAAPSVPSIPVSDTFVQEAGVDEDDLIKSAGDAVYTLHDGQLRRTRLGSDGSLSADAALTLPPEAGDQYSAFSGLYLAGDTPRAAVIGSSWRLGEWQGGCGAEVCATGTIAAMPMLPRVLVQPVSLEGSLGAESRISIDGRLVGSRRIGQQLVVVSTHAPALTVDALPSTASADEREAALAALTAADLLPRVRIGGVDAGPLVAETDCYLHPGNGSPAVEITTVTVFDLGSAAMTRQSRCFVGGTEALYLSTDALVLATTRWDLGSTAQNVVQYPAQIQTDIHRFTLGSAGVDYRASGTVDGHLGWDQERKSLRFSEWNGHLRVLTFTGDVGWGTSADSGTPASPATLTILRDNGTELAEVGRLPNAQRPTALGKPGEQVYAVRFIEDRGYLVTFRQTDPLYVLDLSNPADPQTVGVLEVPGFSQDLVPMGPGWLLGVGRETDAAGFVTGLKVSLFDVRDPRAPRLQDSRVLGSRFSQSALDSSRHGVNLSWHDGVARVALPVTLWSDDTTWRQGLQRLEVAPAAGTMVFKDLIEPTPAPAYPDTTTDRSLQIGDRVLYLHRGALSAHTW